MAGAHEHIERAEHTGALALAWLAIGNGAVGIAVSAIGLFAPDAHLF